MQKEKKNLNEVKWTQYASKKIMLNVAASNDEGAK